MKYAIRALGWTTTILWILIILFSGTVVYSAMQIRMNFEEEPEVTHSNNALTMSIPFSINNGGLYDISELNITTLIVAENETSISHSTSLVPLIPKTSEVNKTHDISLSLDDIMAKNLTHMFLNDTDLKVDMFVALTYAHAIPLRISSNLTMPWGAPLYNLAVAGISIDSPDQVNVSLSFENHAVFSLNGTIRLEIVDSNNQTHSGTTDIFVLSEDSYDKAIPVTMEGVPGDRVEVHLYFNEMYLKSWTLVMTID